MGLSLIANVIGSVLFASVLAAPLQNVQTSTNNGVGHTGSPSLEDRVLVVERKLNLNEHKLNQVDDQMLYIVGIIMHQLNWTNPSYGQNNENVYNQSLHSTMNQNVNHSSTAIHSLQEQVSHPPANHHQENPGQSQSRGASPTPNHQTNVRNSHQQPPLGSQRNNPFGRLFSFEQNSMERTLSRIFFNQPLGGASTGAESWEDFPHHSRGLNSRNPAQYPHVAGRGVGNNHSNVGNRNNNGNPHGTISPDSSNTNSGRNTGNSSPNRNQQDNSGVRSDTNSGADHTDRQSTTTRNNDHSVANNNQQTNVNTENGSPSDKTDQSETPNLENNHPDVPSNSNNKQNENTTEIYTETITRAQRNGNTEIDWPTSQAGPNNKQKPTTFNNLPEDNMTPNSHKNNQHPEMGEPEFLGENETEWGKKDNKFENTNEGENGEHNMMEEEQEVGGNGYHGDGEGEGQQVEGQDHEGNNEGQEEAAPETQQATDLGELQAEHPGESPFERAPRPVLPAEVEK